VKPENWNQMTDRQEDKEAKFLYLSMRGQWLLAKALDVAIETLGNDQFPPFSDIEDMQMIRERLFRKLASTGGSIVRSAKESEAGHA